MCLSSEFKPKEKILRIVFHPKNFRKDGKPKSNIFRSRTGEDEVSVIRFDFTNPDFCKQYGKKIQNPRVKQQFHGFALILVDEIHNADCDIVFTPRNDEGTKFYNPYHSDIKIGYVCNRGEELPAEYQFKVNEMKEKCRIYEDENPETDKWTGEKEMI
jgi:hypothetical protein